MRKGIREGKIQVAGKLLSQGMLPDDVAKVTELPIEEINKLNE